MVCATKHHSRLLLSDSGGREHRSDIVGRFWCNSALEVTQQHGPLANQLGYESHEFLGMGWLPIICPSSAPVVAAFAADLHAGRVSEYHTRNLAKNGEVLHLAIRTFAVHTAASQLYSGIVRLEMWESPRTRVFLVDACKAVIKCWWLAYTVPAGACAWNLVHLTQ